MYDSGVSVSEEAELTFSALHEEFSYQEEL
jgi:hypothetical protein